MKPLALVLFIALLHFTSYSSAQQVDRKGVKATVKLEQVVSGYLTDVNGKYKLRVTEAIYEPGGYIGEHHHVGPGIRYLAAGEWTHVAPGKTTVYKAGDFWYASGDSSNTASNKGKTPVHIINFELLPADLKGGSAIPPKKK